jgi:hypothetical protein
MPYIYEMRFLLAGLVLHLVFLGCDRASREQFDGEVAEPSFQSQNPDEWVTIEGVDFPAEMEDAPDEVKEAYVFAAKHPEVLQYMPCYCGCGVDRHQHRSNYDCFVDQIDRSGERPRIDVDQMGFG